MSEGIVVAIITVIGTLLSGMIGAYATLRAVMIKGKASPSKNLPRTEKNKRSGWFLGFIIGAIVGVIIITALLSLVGYFSKTTPSSSVNTDNTTLVSGDWQLNPVLPEPIDFIGWKSSQPPRDYESGTWTRNEQVEINGNQLVLIFGGLANIPSIGEIGTNTSCFLIASKGPNTFFVDLMSARIEIYDVESTATSLAWAAQKVKVLQETHPSTCGKGIDVVVGK